MPFLDPLKENLFNYYEHYDFHGIFCNRYEGIERRSYADFHVEMGDEDDRKVRF